MKLNIDVDPENKEEIKKAISLLEQFLDEKPKQEVQEQPLVQESELEETQENQNTDFIAQNNAMPQTPQQTQTPQSNTQNNSQQVPAQPTSDSTQEKAVKASDDNENYGETAAAMMGVFNSDVPSNIPLNQLNKNQEQDSDDDEEDMDNDLGLDIVPY